ncbi:MAG: hypothetical protein R3288_00950 [Woeseiaceae bacterium]|nr:hypothetical protein [Woeseiaceae bacterium]
MSDDRRDNEQFGSALRAAYAAREDATPFDTVLEAAERRLVRRRRRRYGAVAAAAAIAAVALLAVPRSGHELSPEMTAELMQTTRWTAPSDVLLPEYERDIYSEMPVLIESTEPVEGALL